MMVKIKKKKGTSNSGKGGKSNVVMMLMAAFVGGWCTVTFQSQNSIHNYLMYSENESPEAAAVSPTSSPIVKSDPSGKEREALESSPNSDSSASKVAEKAAEQTPKIDNPYYGWQPKIADKMECSWRQCLKDDKCNTCRDKLSDMGEAPEPPENWAPDVTMLRRMFLAKKDAQGNPWPPPLDDELCKPIGFFGGPHDDNKDLIDAVPLNHEPSLGGPVSQEGPKLFCFLYTMEKNHPTQIRAIRETWAGGCDGFLAFSTKSDPRIPAISIPHDGPEEYGNMWQKSRSMWKYVHDHYLDQFDFFHIGGEDLFVLPANLRQYLKTLGSPDGEHFTGRRFRQGPRGPYFYSGGAGYTLSRGALRKFINEGYDNPKCAKNKKTAMEDVMIANCLLRELGMDFVDTRDDQGRERYHPFAPGMHLKWAPPKPGAPSDWYELYNQEWGIKLGKDCCAPDSVAFHYIKKPAMVRHLYKYIYECNRRGGSTT